MRALAMNSGLTLHMRAQYGRNAHHEPLVLIQTVQVVPAGAGALFQDLPGHVLRHGDHLPCQTLVCREQHMPLGVADHKIHVRHRGAEGGQLLEVRSVLQTVHIQKTSALQIADGQLAHHPGLGFDLVALPVPGVVVAQGKEGGTQQQQRQRHHAHCHHQLPPVQAFKSFAQFFPHKSASPWPVYRNSRLQQNA